MDAILLALFRLVGNHRRSTITSRRTTRKHCLLAAVLALSYLLPFSAGAIECAPNTECTEPKFTQWCHPPAAQNACGTVQVTWCDDRPDPLQYTGKRTFEEYFNAVKVPFYLCNGYASASAEPGTPVSYNDTPKYAGFREQGWNIHLVTNEGGKDTLLEYSQALRHIYCPSGFTGPVTYVSSTGEQRKRCERPRIEACETNPCTPHPVVPFSQEKRLTVTDFSSAGFELVRFYNSQSKQFQNAPAGGAFGPNWSSNWDRRLIVDGDNEVRALRPEGTQIVFQLNGGEWHAWLGDPSTLTKIPGSPADGVVWRFIDRSDTVESYDAEGRLLRLDFVDGRSFALSYDAGGRLAMVQSRDGRAIVFGAVTIAADTRINSATVPDGTVISYSYSGFGSRLDSVSDQGGLRASYLYTNDESSAYDGSDRAYLLTGVIDPNGQRYSTYKYDAEGLVTESGLAGGAGLTTFSLSSNHVDITSSEFTERRHFATIAGSQRVTSIVRSACPGCDPVTPITKTFTYDGNGYKDLVTDFNGTITNYDHDARGLETIRIEAQGKDTQLANPFSDERKTETDWHASFRVPTERRSYRCSALDTEDPQPCSGDGGSGLWQLESLSRYSHNTRGQTTARCEIDPTDPTAMAYTCDPSSNAPARVRQTVTTYCEAGDVVAPGSTCPLLGLVKTMDGARTDVSDLSTYTYYADDHASCASAPTTCAFRKGDLWKVSNALSQVTEYISYDGAGRVKRMKDANGVITDLTYHPRGWLATRTVRANSNGTPNATSDAVTTLTYDNVGQVTRVTQPDGAFIEYGYDDAHRLTDITDNLGNTLSYTLDAAGNRTAENTRDPSNTLTRTLGRVYDSLGRLHKLLNAQSAETVFTYDANGNQDTVTDALLRVTDSNVDPLNRLIQSTDALMGNTQYRYDARDNLTKVIDAKGLATDYVYDGLSDLMQLVSPDTGTTHYTYDSAGNRATQTDARGVTSTYSYDVLNRLTGIAYPTSSNNVAFSYDQNHIECDADEQFGVGRLTGFTDPSGSTKLCYDLRGNVKRKIAVVNGITRTTQWEYNVADRINSLIYPSGTVVTYGRDGLGRINEVLVADGTAGARVAISEVSYYPFGPVQQITFGSGDTMVRTYDQNYWIDSIDSEPVTQGTTLHNGLDLQFTLDAVGNITGISDVIGGTPPNNNYAYDELYRLTSFSNLNNEGEDYGYDAIGNRTAKTVTPAFGPISFTPYNYAIGSHRLSSVGGMARDYDDNGNTTSRDLTNTIAPTLVYDERNRFSQVLDGMNIPLLSNQYNARGERVLKTIGKFDPSSRAFAYDESGRLLSEMDAESNSLQDYIWLDDLPVGVLTPDGLYFIHPDHLGSPRRVMQSNKKNGNNTAIWDWPILNNPFGEAAPNQDPDGNSVPFVMNLRFPGQYFDAETGLHYNYFRDYEPGTGRYVESDPIGLRGGLSTYAYTGSKNPLIAIDPYGLNAIDYFECLVQQAQSSMNMNCGRVLIRSAVASARRELKHQFKETCEAVGDGIICTTICAVTTFIGEDAVEVIVNAHKQAVLTAMSHAAKKFATGHAKRFIPIIGQIDTVNDVFGTIVCSTDCVIK